MKLVGEQNLSATRDRVWTGLNDPEVLRQCIPGCQSLERDGDDRFKATVEIKIGPIGARFVGAVTLSDLDPPNGYTISGEGQGGTVGFAKGGARVLLTENGSGTLLHYTVEAQVGGRLAQLGGPIIDATAKQLAAKFFKTFSEIIADPVPSGVSETVGAGIGEQKPVVPAAAAPAIASPRGGFPTAWLLALAVAVMAGFLIGRGQASGGSDWMGLAIGLLTVIVAAAGFEYGRRTAAPVLLLDPALLARLADAARDETR